MQFAWKSNCLSLYFRPGKAEHDRRQGEETSQVSWSGESRPSAIGGYPVCLSCYSNQTNLGLKMRKPSPHTHSTSKLKTFYRLVNLQLR